MFESRVYHTSKASADACKMPSLRTWWPRHAIHVYNNVRPLETGSTGAWRKLLQWWKSKFCSLDIHGVTNMYVRVNLCLMANGVLPWAPSTIFLFPQAKNANQIHLEWIHHQTLLATSIEHAGSHKGQHRKKESIQLLDHLEQAKVYDRKQSSQVDSQDKRCRSQEWTDFICLLSQISFDAELD